jgi:subtilisin family serine protease
MPIFLALFLFILTTLSSCGGGGGGGDSSSPASQNGAGNIFSGFSGQGGSEEYDSFLSVSEDEANIFRTSEYNSQKGLEIINAAKAYAFLDKHNLAMAGDDVVIAVSDSGIYLNHPELQIATSNSNLNHLNNLNNLETHGTHVAGIAAATKNDIGMHGVAFNSDILAVKVLGNAPSSGSLMGFKYAADNNAKVINASWIYVYPNTNLGVQLDVGSDDYNFYKSYLNHDFVQAKQKDVNMVIATGNNGYSNYVAPPAVFAQDSDYAGYIIAVASVDENLSISSFSNQCSQVKDYCLVALGRGVLSSVPLYDANSNPINANSYTSYNGTSMATPQVSGAVATLRAAWPHLSAPQVTEILLNSATDLGSQGVDEVYGHGLLNLYAALQAEGQNNLVSQYNVNSAGYDVNQSFVNSSAIFGDALVSNIAPALSQAVFFDDYGRNYQANLHERINLNLANAYLDLNNFALSNIGYNSLPVALGDKTNFHFNLASYKNAEIKNELGLKHALIDNSQNYQEIFAQNNGFSFLQKDALIKNSKFGFSFNIDEISNSFYQDFAADGFILKNNFAANPYQNFMRQNFSNNFVNSRKFNQIFAQKSFFENQLNLNFSYQDSRDSNNAIAISSKRQNEIFDLSLLLKNNKNRNILFSFGTLNEFDDNILNAKSSGAFSSAGRVKTDYFKFSLAQKLAKNIQLITSFSEGLSQINGNSNGIFRQFSNLRSREISAAIIFDEFFGGKFGLSYLEPMRLYSGKVNFDIPIARDNAGNVMRASGVASLVPNGRERDFEIFYSKNLSESENLGFNFILQKQAGNIAALRDNYLGFVSYKKIF